MEKCEKMLLKYMEKCDPNKNPIAKMEFFIIYFYFLMIFIVLMFFIFIIHFIISFIIYFIFAFIFFIFTTFIVCYEYSPFW